MNKLKQLLGLVVLAAVSCAAQVTHTVANRDTNNLFTAANQFLNGPQVGPVFFSNLPHSSSEGTLIWVTDGSATNPCTNGGTGALAVWQNSSGSWNCGAIGGPGGGGSGSGTVNAATLNLLYKNVAPFTAGASSISDNGTTVSTTEPVSANKYTSTVATGTAPLVVASTTVVANLNSSLLLGKTWAAPADIGTGTPGQGFFTNLNISGTCIGCLTGAVIRTPAADQTINGANGSLIMDQGALVSTNSLAANTPTLSSFVDGSGNGWLAYQNSTAAGSIKFVAGTKNISWQSDVSALTVVGSGGLSACTNFTGITAAGCISVGTLSTPFVFSSGIASQHSGGAIWPGNTSGFIHVYAPDISGTNYLQLPALTGILAVNTNPADFTSLTLDTILGSTQCLQVNTLGVVSGTGLACGSGGGGSGVWGSIVGTLSSQTDLQTVLNAKLNTGLALLLSPSASQTTQSLSTTGVSLIAKCPAGAGSTLACFQAVDNAGGNIISALQNDTVQYGTGVGGTITLTGIVGPNSNPATTGQIRVSSTDSAICWRSADNTTNYCIAKTAANIITHDLALAVKETAAGSGIAGYGVVYEDSSTHIPMWSSNAGSFLVMPLETGSMTSGHLVSVNSTTNLLQDSGLALTSVLLGTPTNHATLAFSSGQTVTAIGPGTSGQCYLSAGASADPAFGTCPSGGGATLDAVTAAVGSSTVNNGDNAIRWNFQGTTSGRTSFLFSENTASTSAGTPVLLAARTIASSTANPFEALANGNGVRVNTTGKLVAVGTGSVDVNALSSITGSGAAVLATGATNVALNAEGTGNALTRPFYVEFTPGCSNGTPNQGSFDIPTASGSTFSCFGTTTTQGAVDFPDAVTTIATGRFVLPQGWTGNLDARILWFANSASSNAVRWSVQTGCVQSTGAVSAGPSYNTASQLNSAYTGTVNQLKYSSLTAVPTTNCAAGALLYFQLSRIGGDAGDTLAAQAEALSIQFEGRSN